MQRSNTPIDSAAETIDSLLNMDDFVAITQLLYKTAGIELGPNKRELVFGRLKRRLSALGLDSFADYRALLDRPDGGSERNEMVNALTTNLTSFFREPHHFSYMAAVVLPFLLRRETTRRIRFWSAACSSGEEPYSLAMVLANAMQGRKDLDARILATDIDTNMIARAKEGKYDADKAAAIPATYARQITHAKNSLIMPEGLGKLIAFRPLNLLGPWPMSGPFDVVFCRNVVIYFDKATQKSLFERIAEIIIPGGWLFIGHSESLFRVSDRFTSLGRTIYRRVS